MMARCVLVALMRMRSIISFVPRMVSLMMILGIIFRFFVVFIILIRLVWSRLMRGEGRGLSVRRLVGTGIPRSVS